MVYGCECGVVGRPNRFMTSTKKRLFWLPLSTMNCSEESFTHIYEWKIRSPSFGSSGSIFWVLVVEMMALVSASICFPLAFPLSGSNTKLEHTYDSEAFSSGMSDYLDQHSLVMLVGFFWNSHNFLESFFVFVVLFFACGFRRFS